jgi:hypothetical protein
MIGEVRGPVPPPSEKGTTGEEPQHELRAHTPGPWRAHYGWQSDGLTAPDPMYPEWSEITGGSFDDENRLSVSGHIGIANARLIAAAPDMLDALKEAQVVIDADDCVETSLRISAAIAKAEGRS